MFADSYVHTSYFRCGAAFWHTDLATLSQSSLKNRNTARSNCCVRQSVTTLLFPKHGCHWLGDTARCFSCVWIQSNLNQTKPNRTRLKQTAVFPPWSTKHTTIMHITTWPVPACYFMFPQHDINTIICTKTSQCLQEEKARSPHRDTATRLHYCGRARTHHSPRRRCTGSTSTAKWQFRSCRHSPVPAPLRRCHSSSVSIAVVVLLVSPGLPAALRSRDTAW